MPIDNIQNSNIQEFIEKNKNYIITIITIVIVIIIVVNYEKFSGTLERTNQSATKPADLDSVYTVNLYNKFGSLVVTDTTAYTIKNDAERTLIYAPLESLAINDINPIQWYSSAGSVVNIAANNSSIWGIGTDLTAYYIKLDGMGRYIITTTNPWIRQHGVLYQLCVAKNSAWCIGSDYNPYYQLIDNSGNALSTSWIHLNTNVTLPLKQIICDRNGLASIVFCIDSNDLISYILLNDNGTPKSVWTRLDSNVFIKIKMIDIYNNRLFAIDASGYVLYTNIDISFSREADVRASMPTLISNWIRLLDVINITNICASINYAFCVDRNRDLYVLKLSDVSTQNVSQINARTDMWTKFITLPRQVVQMSSNRTSLWLLYDDGSINYILLTMSSRELQIIATQEEQEKARTRAIALQEELALAQAREQAQIYEESKIKLIQTRTRAETEEIAMAIAEQEKKLKIAREAEQKKSANPIIPIPSRPQAASSRYVDRSTSLSGGAIAGIVIGSVIVVTVIIGLIIYLIRRKRRNETTESND
jgi:hypothetical protein